MQRAGELTGGSQLYCTGVDLFMPRVAVAMYSD